MTSSTNQIFDKVKALSEEENKKPKRKGAWADVEQFEDKQSGLGVIVRKRIRGRPAYSYSIVHFDDRGPNRYIPEKLDTARPVEEVIYLLVQKAIECIHEERKKDRSHDKPRRDKKKGKGKDKRKANDRKSDGPGGGLSALARADAEARGKQYVGKTERKRKKKQGS